MSTLIWKEERLTSRSFCMVITGWTRCMGQTTSLICCWRTRSSEDTRWLFLWGSTSTCTSLSQVLNFIQVLTFLNETKLYVCKVHWLLVELCLFIRRVFSLFTLFCGEFKNDPIVKQCKQKLGCLVISV